MTPCRALKKPWRHDSDHWRIRSSAPPAAAAELAAELETSLLIWQQAFGAYAWDPAELARRFKGRGRMPVRDPYAAILTQSRQEYVAEVTKFEPAAIRSDAIYWTPTKTAWFAVMPGDGEGVATAEARTIRHEGGHQLFAEARSTSPLAGENCGFWAIEAAACYMENAVATPSAGRSVAPTPAACRPLANGSSTTASRSLSRSSPRSAAASCRPTNGFRRSTARSRGSPISSSTARGTVPGGVPGVPRAGLHRVGLP